MSNINMPLILEITATMNNLKISLTNFHLAWSFGRRRTSQGLDILFYYLRIRNNSQIFQYEKNKGHHKLFPKSLSLLFCKFICRGDRIVKGLGKVMYTLLYLKWITNKDLLYNTWNSAGVTQPGWEGLWGRMDTSIGMAESLRCSPETITTLVNRLHPKTKCFWR